jgi:hypothetical protein
LQILTGSHHINVQIVHNPLATSFMLDPLRILLSDS